MPIFEYVCDDCGTKFERLVRGNQAPDKCPQCGQSHLTTALSTFAAHANGKQKAAEFPSCTGGMCSTPDLCGRN
jgi:putative FmdB family regulatory protein